MSGERCMGLDVQQAAIPVAARDFRGNIIMGSILESKASTILESLFRDSAGDNPVPTRLNTRSWVPHQSERFLHLPGRDHRVLAQVILHLNLAMRNNLCARSL